MKTMSGEVHRKMGLLSLGATSYDVDSLVLLEQNQSITFGTRHIRNSQNNGSIFLLLLEYYQSGCYEPVKNLVKYW